MALLEPDDLLCLLRMRVHAGSNTSDLEEAKKIVQDAVSVQVNELSLASSSRVLEIRKYAVTSSDEAGSRIGRGLTPAASSTAFIWDVQCTYLDLDHEEVWIYTSPEDAMSTYMAEMRRAFAPRFPFAPGGSHVTSWIGHIFALLFDAPPAEPRLPAAVSRVRTVSRLELKATEARIFDAPHSRRRKIALALYDSGFRNIRKLASLTGLTRDTVYRELRREERR